MISMTQFNDTFGGVIKRQGWRMEGDRMKAIYEDVGPNYEMSDLVAVCERLRREDRFSFPRFMDMMLEARDARKSQHDEFKGADVGALRRSLMRGQSCRKDPDKRDCDACRETYCNTLAMAHIGVIEMALKAEDSVAVLHEQHKLRPWAGFIRCAREIEEWRKRPPLREVRPGWLMLREERTKRADTLPDNVRGLLPDKEG